jgi:hypothetical protein
LIQQRLAEHLGFDQADPTRTEFPVAVCDWEPGGDSMQRIRKHSPPQIPRTAGRALMKLSERPLSAYRASVSKANKGSTAAYPTPD